jgi:hypothetical protein
MDGRVWRTVVSVGVATISVACGGSQQGQPAGRGTVESEFKRCQEQEQYGEAKGCWHAFLDRFGDVGSAAEIAYAKEHLEKSSAAPAPTAAAPTGQPDDAVTRAAKGASEGLVRLHEKGGDSPSAEPTGGFPPQRVGFDECYKGFRVTGNSEQDVAGLGQRCGAPCGMTPFSGIMSGSQDEKDNVDVYGINLRSDRCYRFFAVGEGSISDLDSAIADADGNVLLRDVFNDAAPILGPEKPFCPPAPARYKFVVSVASGSGTFHFQVWQGARQ